MAARMRIALVALVAVSLFAAVVVAGVPRSPAQLRGLVDGAGLLAPAAFALLWMALTPAMFSGTVLAAASGFLFGVWGGFGVGVAGGTLGALLAYAIARSLAARAVEDLPGRRVARVRERLERRGFAAVLLARLAPGVPTTVLNYVCGVARVRPRDFVAASALGGAPRIFAYTAIGGSAGDPSSPWAMVGVALIVAMGLAALAAVAAARFQARWAAAYILR